MFDMLKHLTHNDLDEVVGLYRLGDWVVEKDATYTQPLQVKEVEFDHRDGKFYYGLHNGYYLSEDKISPYITKSVSEEVNDLVEQTTKYQDDLGKALTVKIELLSYILELRERDLTDGEKAIVDGFSTIITKER